LEFDGGDDPANRESMFPQLEGIDPADPSTHTLMYRFIRRLNRLRQTLGMPFYNSQQKDVWTQPDLNVFLRADCLTVTTNSGAGRNFWRNIRVPHNKDYVNVLNDDFEERLAFKGRDGEMWLVDLQIINGEPKIFCPKNRIYRIL
jgi:hypothetical protein